MDNISREGGCGCGACRYQFEAKPFVAYTCHCLSCQKMTGSAFLTCLQIPAEALHITDGSPAVMARTTDAGNSLRTHFCRDCATTLFAENSARPLVKTIHVGSLDQPAGIDVNAHIWVKRKFPWVTLPPEHRIFHDAGDWRDDYSDARERLG